MSQRFPAHPYLTAHFAPISFEADAADLPIWGEVPKDLGGTLYRNGPNPQFAPRDSNYHWFLGDGMIHAFHIEHGRVSYRNRWVQTPKFLAERAAHRALYGSWGDPITTDPSVRGKESGVANTNVIWHGGKLLAVEEAHQPFAIDPDTLASQGYWDFASALKTGRFTAHPKLDPAKGVGRLHPWTFDLAGTSDGFAREPIDDLPADFPRLDERFALNPYRYGFFT
jgi:carotenoid cleavage dioxygenase-like enzyme